MNRTYEYFKLSKKTVYLNFISQAWLYTKSLDYFCHVYKISHDLVFIMYTKCHMIFVMNTKCHMIFILMYAKHHMISIMYKKCQISGWQEICSMTNNWYRKTYQSVYFRSILTSNFYWTDVVKSWLLDWKQNNTRQKLSSTYLKRENSNSNVDKGSQVYKYQELFWINSLKNFNLKITILFSIWICRYIKSQIN